MGTNYYHVTASYNCECCGQPMEAPYKVRRHIGKKSVGWRFLFRAHKDIRTWDDWYDMIVHGSGYVENEYGERVPEMRFVHLVLQSLNAPNSPYDAHTTDSKLGPLPTVWLDEWGFTFYEGEFS